jgi:hypothetical protein
MTYCFYLAPQVPAEAKRLFAAAAANAGITADGVADVGSHRINAIALFLSREWGLKEFEAPLVDVLETNYEPTWDPERGEFTWGLGLGEEHPRGQYNGFMAAAEAVTPGAWTALSEAPMSPQPGLVEGVDFPTLALAEAHWEAGALRLGLKPQTSRAIGQPTQFKISGLQEPSHWRVEGEARATVRGSDLMIDTTVKDHRIALLPT